MADDQLPPVTHNPEKDDPKLLGEKLLNSELWIAFGADEKGLTDIFFNKQEAFILVGNWLIQNPEIRRTLYHYIDNHPTTRLQI